MPRGDSDVEFIVSVLPSSDNVHISVVFISMVSPLRSNTIVDLTVSVLPSSDHLALDFFLLFPNTVLSDSLSSKVNFSFVVTSSPAWFVEALWIAMFSTLPAMVNFFAGRQNCPNVLFDSFNFQVPEKSTLPANTAFVTAEQIITDKIRVALLKNF